MSLMNDVIDRIHVIDDTYFRYKHVSSGGQRHVFDRTHVIDNPCFRYKHVIDDTYN